MLGHRLETDFPAAPSCWSRVSIRRVVIAWSGGGGPTAAWSPLKSGSLYMADVLPFDYKICI